MDSCCNIIFVTTHRHSCLRKLIHTFEKSMGSWVSDILYSLQNYCRIVQVYIYYWMSQLSVAKIRFTSDIKELWSSVKSIVCQQKCVGRISVNLELWCKQHGWLLLLLQAQTMLIYAKQKRNSATQSSKIFMVLW